MREKIQLSKTLWVTPAFRDWLKKNKMLFPGNRVRFSTTPEPNDDGFRKLHLINAVQVCRVVASRNRIKVVDGVAITPALAKEFLDQYAALHRTEKAQVRNMSAREIFPQEQKDTEEAQD